MNLEQELHDYILAELLPGEDSSEFSDESDLIVTGILDSLAMVNLVTHLEETYGVHVGAAELVPENFGSVSLLARFVRSKLPP